MVTAPVPAPTSTSPEVKVVAPVPPLSTDNVPEVILLAVRSGIRSAASVPEVILDAV